MRVQPRLQRPLRELRPDLQQGERTPLLKRGVERWINRVVFKGLVCWFGASRGRKNHWHTRPHGARDGYNGLRL